ncbi:MAG TPA: hypothetical protein VK188_12280 [Holophaga sp.]|nr:hypothetical protein [Holophaga sp.]
MPENGCPLPDRLKRCDDHLVDFRWGQPLDLSDGGSRRKLPATREDAGPWLILVLESPHVREFEGSRDLWGPVRGASGVGIRIHLGEILAKAPRAVQDRARECRGLVLMNAVQHQCSEGEFPLTTKSGKVATTPKGEARMGLDRRLRDRNFLAMWKDHGGRRAFQERLARIHRPGDVLINACTIGDEGLRDLVAAALDPARFPVDLDCYHPSCWWNPGRRMMPESGPRPVPSPGEHR